LLSRTKTLITTLSKITDPNNNAIAKYMGKTNFKEKKQFLTFLIWKSNYGPLDNFVERIKLYHLSAVGEKATML
jgi:hypothetical protein